MNNIALKSITVATILSMGIIPPAVNAITFKVSGQINQAAIVGGDVNRNADSTVVDNTVTGSRFRFTGFEKLDNDVEVGFRYEVNLQSNPSHSTGASGNGNFAQDVRWSDAYFKGKLGKVSLGKGEAAASNVADSTYGNGNFYSTANLIWLSYRGVYRDTTGNPNANLFAPFDAAGRNSRIQYDSPNFSGFSFAASADNGDDKQFAIRYSTKKPNGEGFKFRIGTKNTSASNADRTAASFLYQHKSGFNIGGSVGRDKANSNLDYSHRAIGYKKGKWGASYEFAKNSNNEEVTSTGVVYSFRNGVNAYFNYADFDVTDGMLVGIHIKF